MFGVIGKKSRDVRYIEPGLFIVENVRWKRDVLPSIRSTHSRNRLPSILSEEWPTRLSNEKLYTTVSVGQMKEKNRRKRRKEEVPWTWTMVSSRNERVEKGLHKKYRQIYVSQRMRNDFEKKYYRVRGYHPSLILASLRNTYKQNFAKMYTRKKWRRGIGYYVFMFQYKIGRDGGVFTTGFT